MCTGNARMQESGEMHCCGWDDNIMNNCGVLCVI